jgi:positive regulator of sigma E activity
VPDAPQFKVGDRVRLITPDGVVWRAAFLLYLVPLVVGLVGAAVGAARSDAFAMAGLVAGLLLGVGCSRVLISRRLVAPVRPIVRPFAADDFQHIEFVKFVRDSTQ